MAIKINQTEKRLLTAGRYPSTLTKILETTKKMFQSEETEPAFSFIFSIPTDKGIVEVHKKVANKNSKKGGLFKLACDLHPEGSIPDDIRLDSDRFGKLIESFLNKRYLVTLSVNGEWNNIVGVSPLGQAELAIDNNVQTKAFKDDEIPF